MKRIFLLIFLSLLIPSIVYADQVAYYVYDRPNRSVTSVVNSAGSIVNNYHYNVFGDIKYNNETISNNFKYAGEQFDPESNLIFLRHRYYDFVIGRFITKDSHPGFVITPQTQNPYPYCNNNSINFVDPNGDLVVNLAGAALGIIVGFVSEGMNPKATGWSIAASTVIGGVAGGLAPNISMNPVALGAITAGTKSLVTAMIRESKLTMNMIGGSVKSSVLGAFGGILGQGVSWLSGCSNLGKIMSSNLSMWLGAAFSNYDYSIRKNDSNKNSLIDSRTRRDKKKKKIKQDDY
ncbi:MAG: RHS repeat-associated core domain-containing protein, partial [Candidatus Omnitrophota bacterium]